MLSNGSVTPMKKVGTRRVDAAATATMRRRSGQRGGQAVEQVVIERLAHEREHRHDDLGRGEHQEQAAGPQSIGKCSTRQAAEPHAKHEDGNDQRDGVEVESGDEAQQALPDHLIEQRDKPRGEESAARIGRRPAGAVTRGQRIGPPGNLESEQLCHAVVSGYEVSVGVSKEFPTIPHSAADDGVRLVAPSARFALHVATEKNQFIPHAGQPAHAIFMLPHGRFVGGVVDGVAVRHVVVYVGRGPM